MREIMYTAPGRTPAEAAERQDLVVKSYRERAAARRRRLIERANHEVPSSRDPEQRAS